MCLSRSHSNKELAKTKVKSEGISAWTASFAYNTNSDEMDPEHDVVLTRIVLNLQSRKTGDLNL